MIRQINFKDGPKYIFKDAILLTADFRATSRLVLSLNAQYTYTEGEFWNRNFTFIAANDNSNAAVNNGRAQVGGDGVTTVIAQRTATNNQPRLDNGGGSSAKLTYTRSLSPRFEYKIDSWVIDGGMNYSRSVNNYESVERGFSNSEGGTVAADWIATRPHPESWEWTIRQTTGPDWFDLRSFGTNPASIDRRAGGARVTNDDRTHITELYIGQLNAAWNVPFMERFPTRLKFGGRWEEENRDHNNFSDWNIWSYVGPGGNTLRTNPSTLVQEVDTFGNWANVGPEYISPHAFDMSRTNALTVINIDGQQGMPQRVSRNQVADLYHARPDLFVHTGTPQNYWQTFYANKRDYRQTVTAGYTQADLRLAPKWQMRFGVRFEETANEFTEFVPITRAELIAAGIPVNATNTNGGRALTIEGLQYQYESNPQITRESKYHNYFPSVTTKYQILPSLEFLAGFNKAISRPPVDNLTGVWNIDENNLRVNAPNSDLLPEYSKNFQSRLGYYFSGRSPGSVSVAISQNDIRNLREQFDFSASEFGVTDPEFAAYEFRTTRNSLERRRFRNLEFAYNQTLGFLPNEYLRGINFNVAYTRSYASQRRDKLSPHRVSSRLGYAYRRFNGSLGMVWRDNTPDSNNIYGRYVRELTQFDLSVSFRLTRWASLYVQGRNITGRPVIWLESPPGEAEGAQASIRQYQEYGANWVFGVKGQF